MTPAEFERRIASIEGILGGNAASVTWDARIPDPDNPEQLRQVDVLIERDGLRTHIECRHRREPQDVQWIEELHGRRASLRADAVFGVSSSGFTKGALRKAAALGVVVRDFRDLTVEEVRDWGRGTRCWIECVQLARLRINVVVAPTLVASLHKPGNEFRKASDGGVWPLESVIKTFAQQAHDVTPRERGAVRLQVFPKDLVVDGKPVDEMFLDAEFRKLKIALLLPLVRLYGQAPGSDRAMVVESAEPTELAVMHAPDGVRLMLDLCGIRLPPHAILQHVTWDLGQPLEVVGVGFIGDAQGSWELFPFTVRRVTKDSGRHRSILRQLERDGLKRPPSGRTSA